MEFVIVFRTYSGKRERRKESFHCQYSVSSISVMSSNQVDISDQDYRKLVSKALTRVSVPTISACIFVVIVHSLHRRV